MVVTHALKSRQLSAEELTEGIILMGTSKAVLRELSAVRKHRRNEKKKPQHYRPIMNSLSVFSICCIYATIKK